MGRSSFRILSRISGLLVHAIRNLLSVILHLRRKRIAFKPVPTCQVIHITDSYILPLINDSMSIVYASSMGGITGQASKISIDGISPFTPCASYLLLQPYVMGTLHIYIESF